LTFLFYFPELTLKKLRKIRLSINLITQEQDWIEWKSHWKEQILM